jgi:hypothetical protein
LHQKRLKLASESFGSAIKSMDEGESCLRKKQYAKAIQFIRQSSIDLLKALLYSTQSYDSGENLNNEFIYKEVTRFYEDDSHHYLEPVLAAFNYNGMSDETSINPDHLKHLYARFNNSIIAVRKVIARETDYNAGLFEVVKKHIASRAGLKRIGFIVIPLLLLAGALHYTYRENLPEHTANLTGEVFWKPDNQTPFNLGFARRFPVRQGGNMNEYLVDLGKTYSIHSFRFDPVHDKHLAIIEIEWIRFQDRHGRLVEEFNPGKLGDWQCHSCSEISSTGQAHRIKVTGKDPYLTSSIIAIDNVSQAVIRMRVLSRKSFWEWLLGIDQ